MIQWVTGFGLVVLSISMLLAAYRVVFGPTVPDRAVALDVITVNAVATIVVYSIRVGSLTYLDSVLVIAILSFLSTVAIAKFIVRGDIIDRDSD